MTEPWSNQSVSLVIIQAGTGFTGLFIYSPTEGHGNLIDSIAAAPGTDPFGNAYLDGISTYNQGNLTFSQFRGGQLFFGSNAVGTQISTNAFFQLFDAFAVNQSPNMAFASPQTALGAGSGLMMYGQSEDLSLPAQVRVAGPLVATQPGGGVFPGGAPETWHALNYNAGWSDQGGTAVTGQYKLTSDNAVWIVGDAKHAAFAGASTIATMPAGYLPAHVVSSNTDQNVHWFQLDTAGNFSIQAAGGATTQVRFDVRFPLDA